MRTISRSLAVLLLTAVIMAVGINAPAARGVEGTLEASVIVVGPERYAYASAVQGCIRCLRAEAAIGAPDGESAILFRNGEVELLLSSLVADCTQLTVWASSVGWGPAHYRVYVSAEGKHWREVGRQAVDGDSQPGVFTGEFGAVRFVKIRRGGWALGALFLDAVLAEGGGSGE